MLHNTVLTTRNPLWVNPVGNRPYHSTKHRPHLKVSCLASDSNSRRGSQPNLLGLVFPQKIVDTITGILGNEIQRGTDEIKKIKGTVVLMKKNVLDFNDFNASVLDRVDELLGQRISLQLVSADNIDPTGEFFNFIAYNTKYSFVFFGHDLLVFMGLTLEMMQRWSSFLCYILKEKIVVIKLIKSIAFQGNLLTMAFISCLFYFFLCLLQNKKTK